MRQGFYAAIDIGTNAARFVIKNVYLNDKHQLNSYAVQELRVPLRLGVDVFRTGSIGMKKEEQLINTMACFKALMEIYDVIDYRALATSAVREAKNGEAIMWRIRKETGVDVKIISGETEAGTIVKIAKDLKLSGDWVFMDVGGGSTEITLCAPSAATARSTASSTWSGPEATSTATGSSPTTRTRRATISCPWRTSRTSTTS